MNNYLNQKYTDNKIKKYIYIYWQSDIRKMVSLPLFSHRNTDLEMINAVKILMRFSESS